jgi:hypothetical protein
VVRREILRRFFRRSVGVFLAMKYRLQFSLIGLWCAGESGDVVS